MAIFPGNLPGDSVGLNALQVDQVVMHFAMDGLILLKESPEAMDQIEVSSRWDGWWSAAGVVEWCFSCFYGGLIFCSC